MSNEEQFCPDWGTEKAQVAPYIAGQGGVVCVCGQARTARGLFLKYCRRAISGGGRHGKSLALDPNSELSRYKDDALPQIEEWLGLSTTVAAVGGGQVLTGISAGGDIAIGDTHIHGGYPPQASDAARTRKAREALSERLKSGPVCIVMGNCHNVQEDVHRWFWDHLLEDVRQDFVAQGFTIIRSCDDGDQGCPHRSYVPPAHETVVLPNVYSLDTGQAAESDAIAHLVQAGVDKARAEVQVETLMQTHGRRPEAFMNAVMGMALSAQGADQ